MKKQGILFFVLRALARQLQRQADFLFSLAGEVERSTPRALPVAQSQTLSTEQDLSNAETERPPADWRARGAADEPPAHWLRRVEQTMPALLADGDEARRGPVPLTMSDPSDQRETERIESRRAVALLKEPTSPAPTQRTDMPRSLLAKSALRSVEEVSQQNPVSRGEEAAPTPLSLVRPRPPVQPKTRLYVIEEQRPSSPSRQSQRETEAAVSPAAESREESEALAANSQFSMRVYRETGSRSETSLAQSQPVPAAPYTRFAQEAAESSIPSISVDWRGSQQRTQGALLHAQAPANVAPALAPSRPTSEPVRDLDGLERRSRPQTDQFNAARVQVRPTLTTRTQATENSPGELDLSPDTAPQAVPAPQSANHVFWSGPDALPSMHINRTMDGAEQRMQEEMGWPALPDETYGATRPWRAVYQVWERQRRLDSEQRGEIWNA